MPTIHLIVSGRVQGVYFRASAKERADALVITGWVRNTRLGSVEIMATASAGQLQLFKAWCHQGPAGAHVKELKEEEVLETAFDLFSIRH